MASAQLSIEESTYLGMPVLVVRGARYEATVSVGGALRVFDFRRIDGPSLFVDLPDLTIETGLGAYRLLGGHRLWVAPEDPLITYAAEAEGAEVVEHDDGVSVISVADAIGVVKGMRIRMGEHGLTVDHSIVNVGDQPIELAAWAITQLVPGGVAVLPIRTKRSDLHGYQATDRVVVWPYTNLGDGSFTFGPDHLTVDGSRSQPAKVGVGFDDGWLAYHVAGELFVKRSDKAVGTYADHGAAGQCYCNAHFLELETLGPLVALEPGASTSHVERWSSEAVPAGIDAVGIVEMLS